MNWILKVDQLSKVYRLGAGATQHGTLYEQISKRVKTIFSNKKANAELEEEDLLKKSEKVVVSEAQTDGLPPGYFWALKDISFEIKAGDRVGLIGQNGSGKSTLLKILSRITAPTHGEFRYRGHLISLLEVGTGFHPELSGRENIYLNAAINGMTRQQINARYKDILEFSELGTQIDTPVKRYSSGMYMRLAFSVAAFLESEILLIDEVLAVGDADFQKKCKEKMLEVANDGRSVIFVSHDMKAIESICKKTIEVSHGKVVDIKDIVIKNDSEINKNELESTPNQNLEAPTPITVSENTQSKSRLCAEQNWEADLKDAPQIINVARLLSCKLISDEGTIQEKFTVNENINLEIRFEVLNSKPKLYVRVDLSSSDGVKLFSSMDNNAIGCGSKNAERKTGIYTEVVTIPKEFLNEGQFIASIFITEMGNDQHAISKIDCLSMKIIDDQLPIGARSNWEEPWPEGLLRPKLAWKIAHNSKNEDPLKIEANLIDEISK